MWVTGVAKRYHNSGKYHPRGKKVWYVYYIDQDFHFGSFRIHPTKVLFYKAQIKKIIKYYCKHCRIIFLAVRSKKIPQCPRCSR